VYTGSTNFNYSYGPQGITLSVSPANTTTTITSSQNPSIVGEPVIFTATINPVFPSTATPTTGTVTWYVDGTATVTTNVGSNGTARFITASLSKGGHTITATYNGGTGFIGSPSNNFSQSVINPGTAKTTTTLTSSVNPADVGQNIQFTATVNAVNSANGTPTGYVLFVVNGVNYAFVPLNSSGQASFQTNFANPGSESVSAIYYGDATFAPGGSTSPLVENVVGVTQVTGLSASVSNNTDGSFNFTAEALSPQNTVVTTYNGTGTLSLISAPSGGGVTGQTSASFVNGVAVFANLLVNIPGTYVFQLTVGGLTLDITVNSSGRQR
jgi:hypothetical protein